MANYLRYCSSGSDYPRYWHYVSFKNQLIKRRKQLGLTLEVVACHLNVSLDNYLKFEEGKQRFSAKMIVKLMDLLGAQIWELTGGKDPNAPIYAEIEKLKSTVKIQAKKQNQQDKILLTFKEETIVKYEKVIKAKDKEIENLKKEVKELKIGKTKH